MGARVAGQSWRKIPDGLTNYNGAGGQLRCKWPISELDRILGSDWEAPTFARKRGEKCRLPKISKLRGAATRRLRSETGANRRMRKLGVGVLGIGEMGRHHAENIRRAVPQARLVAVASASGSVERARQAARELEIEHSYASLQDMLGCKDLEAVVIASPDKFHAQAIGVAAHAGKSILCEKPLALNLADGQAALAAVTKAQVHLHIGFMRRYDPAYAAAKKRIEAGEIGVPVIFKAIGRDKDAPPLSSYEAKLNGMLLYNNTIHDFDMARWLMGDEIREVHCYATAAIRPEVASYGDVVASNVNVRFGKGAIGNIESYVQALYGYDVRTEIALRMRTWRSFGILSKMYCTIGRLGFPAKMA